MLLPTKRRLNAILTLFFPFFIYSQNYYPVRKFVADNYINKTDSLKNIYCAEKTFISHYELPTLIALSFYPELDSTIINLKSRKINKLGYARPKIDFLLRKPKNRHYIIIINKNSQDHLGFDFNDIPFNAQVGFFGHELAHITDYAAKSNMQLLLFGFKYLLKQEKVEKYTDRITIRHNLGWQLYDLNRYITNNPDTYKNYLKYKESKYLNSEEIFNEMLKINDYQIDTSTLINYY